MARITPNPIEEIEYVYALDVVTIEKARMLLRALKRANIEEKIIAIKVGLGLLINSCPSDIRQLMATTGLHWIADLKLYDIPSKAGKITELVRELGFSAVIINASGGPAMVHACVEAANGDLDVYVLFEMSHAGAAEMTCEELGCEARRILGMAVTGVIGPATKPGKLRLLAQIAQNDQTVLAAGVRRQGGDADTCKSAGAQLLIVGKAFERKFGAKLRSEAYRTLRGWALFIVTLAGGVWLLGRSFPTLESRGWLGVIASTLVAVYQSWRASRKLSVSRDAMGE